MNGAKMVMYVFGLACRVLRGYTGQSGWLDECFRIECQRTHNFYPKSRGIEVMKIACVL